VAPATIQHWLKTMHYRPERDQERYWQQLAFINDPHFFRGGEPKNRPRYRPGDLVVIYLSGTYRCPAAVRVTGTASFEPELVESSAQTRPGDSGRWGWVTEVEVIAQKSLAAAPSIEDIGVESRRLMRRARLRLTSAEYQAAWLALRG
jgi:hypothetical protein